DREKYSEIIVVVLRIVAVMNMVIPWSYDYPLQPSIAPPAIGMHQVICESIFQQDGPENPPRREFEKRAGCEIGQVDQRHLDDGGADAGQPVHVSWRVMPLVCPPHMACVQQPMHPVRT